jgi:hypothetical protein
MVVSMIALFVALSGSAAALTVSFARNAGAVDGKSAVSASASNAVAAGKLVATASKGKSTGKIPVKFLDGVIRGSGDIFQYGRVSAVIDNGTEIPNPIAAVPGVGAISVSCGDQNTAVGKVDPQTSIIFQNTSGTVANFRSPNGITTVAPNAQASFTIKANATFQIQATALGKSIVIFGNTQQDGANTASGKCTNYGLVITSD